MTHNEIEKLCREILYEELNDSSTSEKKLFIEWNKMLSGWSDLCLKYKMEKKSITDIFRVKIKLHKQQIVC